MKGYKIYLTRSREVAELIYHAISDEVDKDNGDISSARVGCAYGIDPELLPGMYRTTGYSYCLVEYDLEHPKYEIVFA